MKPNSEILKVEMKLPLPKTEVMKPEYLEKIFDDQSEYMYHTYWKCTCTAPDGDQTPTRAGPSQEELLKQFLCTLYRKTLHTLRAFIFTEE